MVLTLEYIGNGIKNQAGGTDNAYYTIFPVECKQLRAAEILLLKESIFTFSERTEPFQAPFSGLTA